MLWIDMVAKGFFCFTKNTMAGDRNSIQIHW
jgi:hypothetical protein